MERQPQNLSLSRPIKSARYKRPGWPSATPFLVVPIFALILSSGCGGGFDNLPGPAVSIEIASGNGQSANAGSAYAAPLEAIVRDQNGNRVDNATVNFKISGSDPTATFGSLGPSVTVRPNGSGVAVAPRLIAGRVAGNLAVTASVAGVKSPVSFGLTTVAGPASKLIAAAGSGQSAVVGTAFPTALEVLADDQFGNPVSGALVIFTSTKSGPGAVFNNSDSDESYTDANGIAGTSLAQAGKVAGAYNVIANSGPLSAEFVLTNIAGPPAQLMPTRGQDESTAVATAFPQPLVVNVEDAYGNSLSGVPVLFALPQIGAGGSFETGGRIATADSDQSGLAQSPVISANTVAGKFEATASAGIASISLSLASTPGPIVRLNTIGGSNQTAISASPFALALRAKAVDGYDNGIAGVQITFSTPSSDPTGTFAGGGNSITVVSGSDGVATAPALYAGPSQGSFLALATAASTPIDASFALSNTSNGADGITIADAERFLTQTGFGPTSAEVAEVRAKGFGGYLAEQFEAPAFQYPVLADESIPAIQSPFFQDTVSGSDQFRERITLVLSDLFSVSPITGQPPPVGKAALLNILQRDAFTSFSTLLTDVTLSPAMGAYLSTAENRKADPLAGTRPNENYARELMQLFTVGLQRLNQDGSIALGTDGRPIATYDQSDVEANAAIFTGWRYVFDQSGQVADWTTMQADESAHDEGPKTIIDGVSVPPGGTAAQDLNILLQTLVGDPNTGPFICKQLIQHLVTSNPTPEYVARVASVFNDDGNGVRGDMKAVWTAIVLDPEARTAPAPDEGHLMEPQLYLATVLHELGATTDGMAPAIAAEQLGQNPFVPPSVFGFYAPSHLILMNGRQLLAPEFSLETYSAEIARQNFIHQLVLGQLGSGTSLDLSALSSTAAQGVGPLLDQLDNTLTTMDMPSSMRTAIAAALDQIPAASSLERVRDAIELIATSPWFLVTH